MTPHTPTYTEPNVVVPQGAATMKHRPITPPPISSPCWNPRHMCDIVARCIAQSVDAYGMDPELVRLARCLALRGSRLYVLEVDDLQQEALLAAHLAADTFDPERSTWRTYVSRRMWWAILEFARSRSGCDRPRPSDIHDWSAPDDRPDVEFRLAAQQVLGALEPEDHWLLRERFLGERTLLSLAVAQGVSESAMSKRVAQALQRARQVAERGTPLPQRPMRTLTFPVPPPRPVPATATCLWCGVAMPGAMVTRRYCSTKHRVAAHRARHAA